METPSGTTRVSPPRHPVVALLGNPNTGKTTLFNALAGMRQHVGNYPGVTVETKKGHVTCAGQTFDLIDLPGTYSLAPRSPDEMVAVDLVLGQQTGGARPDVVVTVVDASNLERNLYLTTQAMDLGVPIVVALNMIDVARTQGLSLDAERLSRQLGVRVVPIQANKRRGLNELKKAIAEAASQSRPGQPVVFPAAFEGEVTALHQTVGAEVPEFLLRRLLLDVGGYTETRFESRHARLAGDLQAARQRLAAAGCAVPAVEARTRYGWIRQAITGCVERPQHRPVTWTDRLDKVLTHRVWGTLIFLLVMLLVFQAIFTWARPLMKLISSGKDTLGEGLHSLLPPGPLASLLIDGVLEGVGSVVVFLPQILILFGFIAILEDCGYMARAAFLMDKLMSRCGLSGKSFIPMLSSVACAVPGIMAARVIENRRDRLTTILVAPLMSCSARLPVYILIIGAFLTDGHAWWVPGLTMFCMYAIGLVVAPLVAWALKRTLLRGETPLFVMEMPVYKVPSLRTIGRRMSDSGWAFVRRAGTLILAAMIVVWALLYFPRVEVPEEGVTSDVLVARLQSDVEKLEEQIKSANEAEKETLAKDRDAIQERIDTLHGEWKRQSWLGRMGRGIEPVVKPLGWDWKIGMAALASFPAREVVVGTLGIIYNLGKVDTDEIREAEKAGETKLGFALKEARWDDGRPVFTIPAALSLMVFFALCCQCASTLAIIRRETNSWRWPAFTFIYMTVLAYIGALIVFQVGSLFV
jgi:ferrous iron transport protein B